ncbi:hypothetical protein D3C72_1651260 [compost metagenome]
MTLLTARNSDVGQCCGPSTKAIQITTKLSTSCETAVEPVARSHTWRSPVAWRMRWNTATSINWPNRNATSEPAMVHMPCPNTAANAAW